MWVEQTEVGKLMKWNEPKGTNENQLNLNSKASVHTCFYNVWQGMCCTIIASDLCGVIILIN